MFRFLQKPFFFFFILFSSQLFATIYSQEYLHEFRQNSSVLADSFKSLVVQSKGRMKPLDSLNAEILRKLSSKEEIAGLNANQLILGMLFRPDIFKKIPMIKIKTHRLKHLLGMKNSDSYASYEMFFNSGNYLLDSYVKDAFALKPSKRSLFDNELIKVDEKINIAYMVFEGTLFKIFPASNKWLNFKEMYEQSNSTTQKNIEEFFNNGFNRHFEKVQDQISYFHNLQKVSQNSLMPTSFYLKSELIFNEINLFERLIFAYLIMGILTLTVGFYLIFKSVKIHPKLYTLLLGASIIILFIHTVGLVLRWVIGGYPPFSNTYESILYIAYSCAFAGVVFFRHFLLALSASLIMAGIFMFTAHLGHIDPEITTLVPVLKSFWLMIHVSVITASYGFFALCCLLGAFVLLLYTQTDNKLNLQEQIKTLTYINEISMTIGVALLIVGNFLGGVWANESWGRYWGWDPKETWSYISILVYVFILHIRFMGKLYSYYLFNALSLVAFASILMTYFGVNFYLAGMHSYATGDPVPIPTWVYIITTIVICLIGISYFKYRRRV